ncbi:effector-associated domain EAD1-containing protein [uncultured Nostoc sp.]|uniref:effector-associated domain EAD1-containing protein n=1 Tax=uncultured Nostoc sp. TaxID=340711 RepID=UPI0035CCA114
MRLTGQQYKQLTDALIEAFPEQIRLAEILRFRLNKNLNAYAMGNDLKAIVFRLIQSAEAEGWVDELIAGARESNPGNPKLFVLAQELNLATPMPSELIARGSLERIIKKTNSFLNVNTWRETLGKLEPQVCRIEITKKNNYRSFGTGFLIAPNVVITNYHVIEPVLLQEATPNNVILRFDYKQVEGKIINQGTEYRLMADEWLIDQSLYLSDKENRLPTPDELDYALLRLDGVPGKEAIGTKADPSSPERGWIKLTPEIYEFVPDTPLFILQHPQGEPLKLGFDTESIIGINENGTTVKYKTNTEHGSSGSPCFDINWKLVALHHSGDPAYEGAKYNAATPISAICSRLDRQGLLQNLLSGEQIW